VVTWVEQVWIYLSFAHLHTHKSQWTMLFTTTLIQAILMAEVLSKWNICLYEMSDIVEFEHVWPLISDWRPRGGRGDFWSSTLISFGLGRTYTGTFKFYYITQLSYKRIHFYRSLSIWFAEPLFRPFCLLPFPSLFLSVRPEFLEKCKFFQQFSRSFPLKNTVQKKKPRFVRFFCCDVRNKLEHELETNNKQTNVPDLSMRTLVMLFYIFNLRVFIKE